MPLPLLVLTFLLVLLTSPALGQNATPGLVFSSNAVTVTEGGTQTYTVTLATAPSATVTVRGYSQDTGAATVLPLRLTFTTENWNTAQTVTVTGVADPDRVAETVTLTHSAVGGDYGTVTGEVTATVTDTAGFTLSCGSTVAEGATLTCTLSNPGTSAAPWPGVAMFHRSDDTRRALIRGGAVDVEFGTLTPADSADFDQEVEGGMWWVGQVLVAYERFDWSGEAAANASRSIPIAALDDALYEGDEQFYITLTPDGTRNATALYYDEHKQTITVTDTDTASTDTSLASLDVRAPGAASAFSTSLSGTAYTASVGYEVSEVVVAPTATHHAATIVVGSDAEAVASGGTSRIFKLAAGTTTSIPVTVTAEDGTSTQTSTIALTRAGRPQTVTVATDSFSLVCPAEAEEGTTLSCTLTNTGSRTQKFPVVALLHSSLDDDLATVTEDPILPASDPAYRDDVSFLSTVRTSAAHAYTYGYGELFSGGSEEYVTYGYEKYTKTDDDTTTTQEDEAAAGATQTVSIEPHFDAMDEEVEQFYVGLAPAAYTGLKQLVANKVPLRILSVANTVPTFGSETAMRRVVENAAAHQPIGAPVAATDADNDPLTYSLGGTDAAAFTLDTSSGQLQTKGALNYEMKDSYHVTVHVTDGEDTEDNQETTATIDDTIAVTVTVTDAPGTVTLSLTRPLVGHALTATVADPESPVSGVTWRWARSADGVTWSPIGGATTATYTPGSADQGHALRATVRYTDADGTAKAVTSGQTQRIDRQGGGPPGGGPPGGGPPSGGGGGGGPACAEDVHGNSAAQATSLALATETAGAICPAADVDYLTVTAPGPGLLFVDTFGSVPLRGSLWQHDVVVASGSTRGGRQDDRLGARVQAGPVVIALQGQGGATGDYDLLVTFVRGALENPGAGSFQSGVGVLSGWVCAAEAVEIELNGVPQEAAYGTERLDTAGVCGDADNGFGLLFNWNLLGEGEHEVVALVDGVELGRATVRVTTLGEEFLWGAEGECRVEDFPVVGEMVTLRWQQTSQNFVIAGGSPPSGTAAGQPSGLTGHLENPGPHSFQSGVLVLSGWVCEADRVELEIGTAGRQVAAYGTERVDTEEDCGDTNNGFGLLFNWNLLGDGEHEVVAFVDGVELGRATVRVTTLGEEFLRGAEGECVVDDFPLPGQTVTLEWQQDSQNFVITDVE